MKNTTVKPNSRKGNNCLPGKKLLKHDLEFYQKLKPTPFNNIAILAGADEVGRGALAGPVVATVACLPTIIFKKKIARSEKFNWMLQINDSKKLTSLKREYLAEKLRELLPAYAIAFVAPNEIDRMNILNASRLAILRAISILTKKGNTPTTIILDAININSLNFVTQFFHGENSELQQHVIKKADETSWIVAAASILAKVARDEWMKNQASSSYLNKKPLIKSKSKKEKSNTLQSSRNTFKDFYGFSKNKGYGTLQHRTAIKKYGICECHRKSFTNHLL